MTEEKSSIESVSIETDQPDHLKAKYRNMTAAAIITWAKKEEPAKR